MGKASSSFLRLIIFGMLFCVAVNAPERVGADDSFAFDAPNDAIQWCDQACMNGEIPDAEENLNTEEHEPLSREEQAKLQNELGRIEQSQAEEAAERLDQVFAAMLRLNEEMLRDNLRRLEHLKHSQAKGIFAEELLKHPFFKRNQQGLFDDKNSKTFRFEFHIKRR